MRLLITGAWKDAKEHREDLERLGHELSFMQNERDELPMNAEDAEGVICNGLFLHHDIEKFKSLRYIQLTSAGLDRVPMDYVNAHGIAVNNARGVYSIPMSEFAVSGVLQLYKKTRFFYENQKNKIWQKNSEVLEIFGKTVSVIGCGSVGTECAKRFFAFGCRVIGVDLFPPKKHEYYEKIFPLDKLDACLEISDIVVLTLPLTSETRHMINAERLGKIKRGAVLVNIARGAVVDEEALLPALDERLAGAVLDVFEDEPLSDESPLWEKENVIITPHNSFAGDGNGERLWHVICGNLENLL